MHAADNPRGSAGDSLDDVLDAGLRAAFGGSGAPRDSVVASLGDTMGIQPRILLREAPDEPAAVAIPAFMARHGAAGAQRGLDEVGRYHVAGEVARGGVGVILKGRDPDLGRDVAIKMLRKEYAGRSHMVQRFVEEAQIGAQLQHPGILPVYEVGLADQQPFFTMKLIKGRTLADLLNERPDPAHDRQRFVAIFGQVCQAMAYAHAKGVVHRDIKPSNVLVGSFGEVQVVDWGLAKVLSRGGLADELPDDARETIVETVRSGSSAAQSVAGSVMGTPAYMSPEQASGHIERLDERSDVFSLGAMLCEILSGEPPYGGSRGEALADAAECRIGRALQRLENCAADPELCTLVWKCMQSEPAQRPRTAEIVARDIEDHLASLEQRARSLEVAAAESAAQARGERKARRLTLLLSTLVVLTVAAGAFAAITLERQRSARQQQGTQAVNDALQEAAILLGEMSAAPPTDTVRRESLLRAVESLESQLATLEVQEDTAERAQAFLDQAHSATRDHLMIERIEQLVMTGATHTDLASWVRMEQELRAAFLEYGLDLVNDPPEELAEAIRKSPLAVQLTDGVELWLGSAGSAWANAPYTEKQMRQWLEIVYDADPDAYRTALRRQIYNPPPDLDTLRQLEASKPYEDVLPRTLSWLGMTLVQAGDVELGLDVYRKAATIYPEDFMLNFDMTIVLSQMKRWEEATRYYMRCVAIRPQTGGAWRSLGVALVEQGETDAALQALDRAVELEPQHAPSWIDLGRARSQDENSDGALEAYREAIRLDPQFALPHCRVGLILQDAGHLDGALQSFRRCQALDATKPMPSTRALQYIDACEALLLEREQAEQDDERP